MRVLFIQQDHVSPPGPLGEAFTERGYDVVEFLVVPPEHFAVPGIGVQFPDPADFDAIVPMGAPWSVYDTATIDPWITDELALLRRADELGVPVLGVCFGGQALAAAHGGVVMRAATPEVGWVHVDSDDPGLVEPGPWFEWHSDRWIAPPGAVEIARTEWAPQAFVLRRNLGVQFHPELTATQLTGWLDNGGADYLAARGMDAAAIHDETVRQGPAAAERSRRLVHRFLDRVASTPAEVPARG
ncbi:type 1 glutamine amidotransferase [Blastococcus sp. SYSU D00820]